MNLATSPPVKTTMPSYTQPNGAVESIDELDFYPFGVPTELQVPLPRQTDAEVTAQYMDFERRMAALRERRIVANGGRDSQGDIVIRHGVPHPAYRGPGLPWLCEYPSLQPSGGRS